MCFPALEIEASRPFHPDVPTEVFSVTHEWRQIRSLCSMKEIAGSFLTFLGRSILGFLLIFLGLTGPCAMTAFAQEQEKKPPYTPETAPVWLRATPAATNVLTTFEVHNGEVNFRHIEA